VHGLRLCMEKCPSKNSYDHFNFGVALPGDQHTLPQAIPRRRKSTRILPHLQKASAVFAPRSAHRAINYEMQDEIVTEDVGAIIVASGYGSLIWTNFRNMVRPLS